MLRGREYRIEPFGRIGNARATALRSRDDVPRGTFQLEPGGSEMHCTGVVGEAVQLQQFIVGSCGMPDQNSVPGGSSRGWSNGRLGRSRGR